MPDLFISYSRRDSDRALELAEHFRGWGVDVWIDSLGIDASDQWPKEIVQAIWGCKAFVVLLSEASLGSKNVLRELSLAVEQNKPIVPVKLTAVKLNEDFAYQLAGVQHVAATDIKAIERSLAKLGVIQGAPTAKKQHAPRIPVPQDSRISLIVLPFEDLSPAGEDNTWFADGLAGELIDAFAHIKSLRVLDRKTSLGLRGVKLGTAEIGKEYNSKYFIEGSVRKFGEQLKISVSLLDIASGAYLWQESFRGEFKDIFDIQESVAKKVVEGLKLHLTTEEKSQVAEHGTKNPEAYKLFVKAREYFDRHTKAGFQHALKFVSDAIEVDPHYAEAYAFKASTIANLFLIYKNDGSMIEVGMQLALHALDMKPDLWEAYGPLSLLYQIKGESIKAEDAAKTYTAYAPANADSHFALASFYSSIGEYSKSIPAYEKAVELDPEYLPYIWNLILASHHAGDKEKRVKWSLIAIPLYERHLKFFPEDEFQRACYASLLHFAAKDREALEYANTLTEMRDGTSLYSLACLYCELGDFKTGMETFRKSLQSGYRNSSMLQRFLTNEIAGIGSLNGSDEYIEIQELVQKITDLN